MSIYEKLSAIQVELKAPKGRTNSFGHYQYRSAEDILEAAKPACTKYNTLLRVTDRIRKIGDRYYVEATAILTDIETDASIWTKASAREDTEKKGMDGSQVTGASSSYARKYALNGLFCIDDTKDADTDEYAAQKKAAEEEAKKAETAKKEAQKKHEAEARHTALRDAYIKNMRQLNGAAFDVQGHYQKTYNHSIYEAPEDELAKAVKKSEAAVEKAANI